MGAKRKVPLTSPANSKTRHTAAQSHKATQARISSYHTLLKRKHQLERDLRRDNDDDHAAQLEGQLAAIEAQLEDLGGLESYQAASIKGQSRDRGGDSAKVFIAWLKELGYHKLDLKLRSVASRYADRLATALIISLLEIGALTPDNYDSCAKWIDNEPIDLHSQHPSITEQDFFERPIDPANLFDLISCSLVLNFVPDPRQRGQSQLENSLTWRAS
jgi:25S rRNA (adenine2142-N1)-methyltransferase